MTTNKECVYINKNLSYSLKNLLLELEKKFISSIEKEGIEICKNYIKKESENSNNFIAIKPGNKFNNCNKNILNESQLNKSYINNIKNKNMFYSFMTNKIKNENDFLLSKINEKISGFYKFFENNNYSKISINNIMNNYININKNVINFDDIKHIDNYYDNSIDNKNITFINKKRNRTIITNNNKITNHNLKEKFDFKISVNSSKNVNEFIINCNINTSRDIDIK